MSHLQSVTQRHRPSTVRQRIGRDPDAGAGPGPGIPKDPALRRALADAWQARGNAAQARLAAHCQFALDLVHLRAPSRLIRATAQTLQLEVDHSRECLELAHLHGATHSAPAAAAPPTAPDEGLDLAAITTAVVRSGCIDATVSAVHSREELEQCQDGFTRELLLRRHRARARHAQVSWQFLAWVVRRADRELLDQIKVVFLTELSDTSERLSLSEWDRQLLRHGILAPLQEVASRQHVLRSTVIPCMETALARRD